MRYSERYGGSEGECGGFGVFQTFQEVLPGTRETSIGERECLMVVGLGA